MWTANAPVSEEHQEGQLGTPGVPQAAKRAGFPRGAGFHRTFPHFGNSVRCYGCKCRAACVGAVLWQVSVAPAGAWCLVVVETDEVL